jgi:hypothetical protein
MEFLPFFSPITGPSLGYQSEMAWFFALFSPIMGQNRKFVTFTKKGYINRLLEKRNGKI